jgi:predicted short-subunit dehydrogenase-like oxidoreductase (DUF2520 family)
MLKPDEPIGFIGAGRTANTLALAMHKAGYKIISIASQSYESAASLALNIPGCSPKTSSLHVVETCKIVIMTVPDDSIKSVSAKLPWQKGQGVIHCSGVLSLKPLESAEKKGAMIGSLHPYQTFPKGLDATASLPGSVFAIEGSEELKTWLGKLVKDLGCKAITISPKDRPLYHTAAVMGCGLLTTLIETTYGLWEIMGFSEKETKQAVLSLAKGTLRGMEQQESGLVATGPITRGDVNTLKKHMEALAENMPEALPLYQQLGLRMVTLTLNKGSISDKQATDMEIVLSAPSSPNSPGDTNK